MFNALVVTKDEDSGKTAAAVQQIGIEDQTQYQGRHGGAAHDRKEKLRDIPEIQKRSLQAPLRASTVWK